MGVTDGQRRALVGASASQDLFLIQGPPGTGKTSVIAALLRHFARERRARVLLSSKSHRPIDNARDRLGQGELHVLRIGQTGKVTGAGQEVRFVDVLAQAEQDVPQRHLAARTELDAWLQSLSVAERLLAKLQALNDRLGVSEPTMPRRVAEIEPERSHAHQAIRRRDFRLVHPLERERAVTGAIGLSALDQLLRPLHRMVNRLHKGFTKPSTAGPTRPAAQSCSVVLSRARIVILVGDHQQLPPYLDNDLVRRCVDKGIDTAWLEMSVFEHLWDRLPEGHRARLDVQFRMPEIIASFLGREFYAGELQSATATQGMPPVCSLFQAAVVLVDTSGRADRGETAVSPGFVNDCEAQLLAAIAARLPAQYRTGEGLGLIAPYSAQVTAARQAVSGALGRAGGDPWLWQDRLGGKRRSPLSPEP